MSDKLCREDFEFLDDTACFTKRNPYDASYELYNFVKQKPYLNHKCTFLNFVGKFLPIKLCRVKTEYLFNVVKFGDGRYYCFWDSKQEPGNKILFEKIFEQVSSETKEMLIYHLDILGKNEAY